MVDIVMAESDYEEFDDESSEPDTANILADMESEIVLLEEELRVSRDTIEKLKDEIQILRIAVGKAPVEVKYKCEERERCGQCESCVNYWDELARIITETGKI